MKQHFVAWANIEIPLVRYMEFVRDHRLRRERKVILRRRKENFANAWSDYQRLQDVGLCAPGLLDMQNLPPISALLESRSEDAVTRNVLTGAIQNSLPLIDSWRIDRLQILSAKARPHLPVGCAADCLPLAVCVFSCGDPNSMHTMDTRRHPKYQSAMWYPEYFYHPCNHITRLSPTDNDNRDGVDLLKVPEYPGYRRSKLNLTDLEFNASASIAIREILDDCHMDYKTTTSNELDAIEIRVFCRMCHEKSSDLGRVRAMSWRRAVSLCFLARFSTLIALQSFKVKHRLLVHWLDNVICWTKLSESDAIRGSQPTAIRELRRASKAKIWRCGFCRDKPFDVGKMSRAIMTKHLKLWCAHWIMPVGICINVVIGMGSKTRMILVHILPLMKLLSIQSVSPSVRTSMIFSYYVTVYICLLPVIVALSMLAKTK